MTEAAEPYICKRKRGRPGAEHRKTKVTVALDDRVLVIVDKLVQASGQTRADFIRACVGQRVLDVAATRKIIEALATDDPPSTDLLTYESEQAQLDDYARCQSAKRRNKPKTE